MEGLVGKVKSVLVYIIIIYINNIYIIYIHNNTCNIIRKMLQILFFTLFTNDIRLGLVFDGFSSFCDDQTKRARNDENPSNTSPTLGTTLVYTIT